MIENSMVPSLAGTGKNYLGVQVRLNHDGRIKVQLGAPKDAKTGIIRNTPYGWTADLPVLNGDFLKALGTMTVTKRSLNSDGTHRYFEGRVRIEKNSDETMRFKFQIPATKNAKGMNRPYGYSFAIVTPVKGKCPSRVMTLANACIRVNEVLMNPTPVSVAAPATPKISAAEKLGFKTQVL